MTRRASILVGLLAATAHAQAPVGGPIPERTLATAGEANARHELETRLADAKAAFARNDVELAKRHLAAALAWAPASAEVMRVGLAYASETERPLWAERWWLASMDAKGRLEPDRATAKLLPEGELDPRARALARVAAVEKLARFAGRHTRRGKRGRGDGVLVRWAQQRAYELMRPAPALQRAYAPRFAAAIAKQKPDYKTVIDALRKVMSGPEPDLAMRAARCLTGLGAQAAFKKLEGPRPPDVKAVRKAARAARAKLRASVAAASGEPWTVAKLEALTEAQREAFNRAHAHWSNPARGISPTGLYLVETVCGHRTLLGALQTIEMHHMRLANWFGKDPFTKRRGTVRIVPEAAGLESEDSPFWWAGGFQRGDLTVLRFSWGTIAGLGRGLTHELTHRFDGVLRPFLPAWLVEGRAVWTAKAYGLAEDTQFVERSLDPWTVQTPFVKGYGGRRKLEKLLAGTIDDYRDNYTAGYALFTFLRSWTIGGKPVFAKRLEQYLRRARLGRKKPVEFFASHFADGKAGRPKGIDAFMKLWHGFLHGCYQHCWREPVPWIGRYATRRLGGRRNELVKDEPTWSWARNRAEPWFGDAQAADAGFLLAEAGRDDAAVAAWLWSLETDGWRRDVGPKLAALCDKLGKHDVAWVVRDAIARRSVGARPSTTPPPFARLPELHGFVVRQRLSVTGLTEDGLTGYEERRVRGLWFEDKAGDLHVGRRKPRDETGVLDRTAHQRHAFVRTIEWQAPGAYVVRTRVNFTTSFVSGAVILGWTRRDRNVRIGFSAGDFLYSIGRKNAAGKTKTVSLSVHGLWDREGPLRSRDRHKHEFERPVASFVLEARVIGPTVYVSIEGQQVLSYTTADLSPIEGAIGFAMGQGAVRLLNPTVQRLDGVQSSIGLDLGGGGDAAALAAILGRVVRGVPRDRNGTIVVFLPAAPAEVWPDHGFGVALQRLGRLLDDPLHYPQAWVVAVPKDLGIEAERAMRKRAKGRHLTWIGHGIGAPLGAAPWLLFVDADGVLRVAARLRRKGGLPWTIDRWARCYRTR